MGWVRCLAKDHDDVPRFPFGEDDDISNAKGMGMLGRSARQVRHCGEEGHVERECRNRAAPGKYETFSREGETPDIQGDILWGLRCGRTMWGEEGRR